jgi:hypothetical protein
MAAKQQAMSPAEAEQQEQQHRSTAIGKQVMHALGQPGDLQRVEVRHLWQGYYRVNILVGGDVTSVRIANSYFLVADGEGHIIESTPTITRQYS